MISFLFHHLQDKKQAAYLIRYAACLTIEKSEIMGLLFYCLLMDSINASASDINSGSLPSFAEELMVT